MSPTTFKFFSPRGDCRRITYEGTPELATINELVDGMVEGRRLLTYRDSEGDVVLLKTSRDVAEAVKDAKDSGSQSIKVNIRLIRECPRRRSDDGPSSNHDDGQRRAHRRAGGAPQWGRCWSRGLFGHPQSHYRVNWVDLEDEVNEVVRHLAPFFGIRVRDDHAAGNEPESESETGKEAQATGKPASGSEEHPLKDDNERNPVAKEAAKQAEDTPSQEAAAKHAEETPSPKAEPAGEATTPNVNDTEVAAAAPDAIEEDSEAAGAAGFTFVENEPEGDDKAEETAGSEKKETEDGAAPTPDASDDAVDEKLKLLKDMGFELPKDVARKMIKELNGRMDLIVRALVANQK